MRQSTANLQDILSGQQAIRSHLFNLRLGSGAEYNWTNADVDIYAHGTLFSSSGPSITGARNNLVRGMQVSTLDLSIKVTDEDIVSGVSWSTAVRSGALDGAVVTIYRAYMRAWGDPAETIVIFKGKAADVQDNKPIILMKVNSDASRFDTKIPCETFQPGCSRRLYSPGCDVSRQQFSSDGAVTAILSRYQIRTTLSRVDGFFALGDLLFTSGSNTGVRRSIKAYVEDHGLVTFSFPLSFDVQIGDSFIAAAGCDRTRELSGCAKFGPGVELRFKGTPYVPTPESVT